MPGTWPDGEPVADDGDDERPMAPPVHPDDRIWRHPSEVAWAAPPPVAEAAAARTSPPRVWALALTAGLTGAALALGVVALAGGIGGGAERVVERIGVRDQLSDPLAARSSPGALTAMAEDVMASVVRLEVDGDRGAPVGSGVVVLDDGHILTNAHVVEGARSVTIVLADGTSVAGRVVGTDPVSDIAVVAPAAGAGDEVRWVPAVRGPAAELAVGEPAVAIGSPLALDGTPAVTLGVVAGLGRRVTTDSGTVLHGMIQTDAPIAPGSSGGALCDRTGRVVGVVTSQGAGDDGTGLGFATPMEVAWATAETLITDGVVHHVWLGIEGRDVDGTVASLLGLTRAGGGVLVERVLPSSPAADAGVADGDVLRGLDGEALASMSDLVVVLRAYRPGDEATLRVLRGGEELDLEVTLAEREG